MFSTLPRCLRIRHGALLAPRRPPTPATGSGARGGGGRQDDSNRTRSSSDQAAPRGVAEAGRGSRSRKVLFSDLAPYPPAAFEGCPRCSAVRANSGTPAGSLGIKHQKAADGTPAPGCFHSGLATDGAPLRRPAAGTALRANAAAPRLLSAAQSSQPGAWHDAALAAQSSAPAQSSLR